MRKTTSSMAVAIGVLALVLASCATTTDDGLGQAPTSTPTPSETTSDDGHMMDDDDGHMTDDDGHMKDDDDGHMTVTEGAFGRAGNPDRADRVIKVRALDSLRFQPDTITVTKGETITFRLVGGQIDHDFTIGDEAAQTEHGEAMMQASTDDHGHGDHHEVDNAITMPANETVRFTWKFTRAGTFLYGCHVPGHYDAGMVGTIIVEEA